jgi:exopolysaccharide production protein ExoZ
MNDLARSRWIDVMRAAACLAVLLYHAVAHLHTAESHPAAASLAAVGLHGWLGVPVFFALSGFCICESIARRATVPESGATAFWLDRGLRIYPVFWAALLFASLLASVATPFNGASFSSAWPPSLPAAITDLSLVAHWLEQPSGLLVSWSLNYEIAFYLVVGLTLLPGLRSPARRLGLIAAVTACVHLCPTVFEFTALRLWPHFACGCLAHFALRSSLPFAVRSACLAYPLVALILNPDAAQFAASLSALALVPLVLMDKTLPSPLLLLVHIGLASYSIYLVHVPLVSPFTNLVLRFFPVAHPGQVAVVATSLLLALGGGMIFYRLVELPLEKRRRGRPSHSAPARVRSPASLPREYLPTPP